MSKYENIVYYFFYIKIIFFVAVRNSSVFKILFLANTKVFIVFFPFNLMAFQPLFVMTWLLILLLAQWVERNVRIVNNQALL
jgi:hypothetical protein